jgi:hypothetical protein
MTQFDAMAKIIAAIFASGKQADHIQAFRLGHSVTARNRDELIREEM